MSIDDEIAAICFNVECERVLDDECERDPFDLWAWERITLGLAPHLAKLARAVDSICFVLSDRNVTLFSRMPMDIKREITMLHFYWHRRHRGMRALFEREDRLCLEEIALEAMRGSDEWPWPP